MLPTTIEKQAERIALKTAGARYGLEVAQPNPKVGKVFDDQILEVIGGTQSHNLLTEFAMP